MVKVILFIKKPQLVFFEQPGKNCDKKIKKQKRTIIRELFELELGQDLPLEWAACRGD